MVLTSLLAAAVMFSLWLPYEILNPFNTSWALNGDAGTHHLGFRALCLDRVRFPIAWTKLGLWPAGFSIAFSDSLPLISVPLSLLGSFTDCDFQFLGLFLFASLFLQILVASLIFRELGFDHRQGFMAALLLGLFPPLFHRYWHVALTAHWLILLCILGLLSPRRGRPFFFAVSQLTVWINFYFFPIACCFALINRTFKAGRLSLAIAFHSVVDVALIVAGALVSLALLGFFQMEGGAAGFGEYSMNLLGPINPMERSRFLPDLAVGHAGQLYEGFHYLGLGCIGALLAAAALLVRRPPALDAAAQVRVALMLATMATFSVIALSNKVYLGPWLVLEYTLPDPLSLLARIFRTAGRYFWVVSYLAIILALWLLWQRVPKRPFKVVLAALLLIQLADVRIAPPPEFLVPPSRSLTADAAAGLAATLDARGIKVAEHGEVPFGQHYILVEALIERRIAITDWYVARPPKGHTYPTTRELLGRSGAFVGLHWDQCRAKEEELGGSLDIVYGDGYCFIHR
ncbi:MAG: hypothetical protein K0R41_988 [Geminicoccaceae bacterium]|nr:hypothetical protein [Geminicoccaceae bacterium]